MGMTVEPYLNGKYNDTIFSLLLIWSVFVTFVTKLLIFDDYAAKNPIDIEIEQILFLVSILRTYSGR